VKPINIDANFVVG